jgi:hypothetical protein
MILEELNRIKPSYFYETVAKKTGVSKEIVEDVYNKFLARVTELSKTELKIVVKGLGTFERHPNCIFTRMYEIWGVVKNSLEHYESGVIYEDQLNKLKDMESLISDLEKLKVKYKYVEKSIEKFWANCGGFEEFIDRQGRVRKDFEIKKRGMQQLPLSIEECEELEGVL